MVDSSPDKVEKTAQSPARFTPKLWGLRAACVVLGLVAWFATQAGLGAREAPQVSAPSAVATPLETAGELLSAGDAVHQWTESWTQYLAEHRHWAHRLLIASSAMIDVLGLFLLGWAIFGRSLRPFVGLLILFMLRQLAQVTCALPAPHGMIWEDPGFPSLLVTYSVANDFFFSGHTALAVYGAIELGRFGGRKLRVLAFVMAFFLAGTVLVLRAHYTMDVYAGVVTALLAALVAPTLSKPIDAWIDGWTLPTSQG